MGFQIKKLLRHAAVLVAAAATLGTGGVVANAAEIQPYSSSWGTPGYAFHDPSENGGSEGILGVYDRIGDHFTYCMEKGAPLSSAEGTNIPIKGGNTGDYGRLAWLSHKYRNNTNDTVQAGIAYLVHEKIDLNKPAWADWKKRAAASYAGANKVRFATPGQSLETARAQANKLWAEAVKGTPESISGSYKYTVGKSRGYVTTDIKNVNHAYVAGVPYKLVLTGPAVWDANGKKTLTGTTASTQIRKTWHATGNGKVVGRVYYSKSEAMRRAKAGYQTKFYTTDPIGVNTPATVSFNVDNRFNPGFTSNQTDHRIENGQIPEDTVTSTTRTLSDGKTTAAWPAKTSVKADGVLYYSAKALKESATVPAGLTKVASASKTFTGSGQTQKIGKTDIKLDAQYSAQHPGVTVSSLPTGYYYWVWGYTRNAQSAATQKLLEAASWSDGIKTAEGNTTLQAMQPVIGSSVSEAYKGAVGTVTGVDGKQRPAVQDTTTGSNADGVVHIEKGVKLKDIAKVNVADINKDGKIDTNDWLHTKAGQGEGKENENNQISITVKGEAIGVQTSEQAKKLMDDAKKGAVTQLPEGAMTLATTEFKTNKAGDYLVSNDEKDKTKAVAGWQLADGVDEDNLPSGYLAFRWTILNKDQSDIESQTGIPMREATDKQAGYPFVKDADDGYYAKDEVLNIRLTPYLDSEASTHDIKVGETTTDKLIIGRTNEKDLWPTYAMTDVTEGEQASEDPVPLDFHGYLVKVSDDSEASVSEDASMSDEQRKNAAHDTTITGVTDFGSRTTDAYKLTEVGTYVWYWEMTPNLKGATKLDDLAWRQLTHSMTNHAFGKASEIVRVTKPTTPPTPPSCEISTKAQGKVTMKNGKAELTDTASINCAKAAKIEFELWQQSNGDQGKDVKITVTPQQDVNGKTSIDSPTVTVTDSGKYYWREKAYDENGSIIAYGKPRLPGESVEVTRPECVVSTKSQGEVTLQNGKAVLHDEASLDCVEAAKIEYELWKQTAGPNPKNDVLIHVTPKHKVSGNTDRSEDVTVTDSGTYYWRERTFDSKGNVISYGDARVSQETVKVRTPLAQTGMGVAPILAILMLAGAAGIGLHTMRRRNTIDA